MQARITRGLLAIPEPGGVEQQQTTITVAEVCERFIQEYSRPKLKDRDRYMRSVRAAFNQRIKPYPISTMPVTSVRRQDGDLLRDALKNAGYQNGTINDAVKKLSAIINWAREEEIITCKNTIARVERMPVVPSGDHYTLEEVHRLLEPSTRHMMIVMALYTGMRKGELFGLCKPCVRLDAEPMYIDVNKSYAVLPKGGKPRRIPIHPELAVMLRQYWPLIPETPEGLVFPHQTLDRHGTPNGYRMGDGDDMEDLRDILQRAGIRHDYKKPWHAFRHTFSTLMEEAGAADSAIGRILGHSSSGSAITAGYKHGGLRFMAQELARMTLLPPAPAGISSLDEARRLRAG